MVIWIIGLSASGKTTFGKILYQEWKKQSPNTVLIDGDEIRRIFQHDQTNEAYTVEERRKNADRISKLCMWLDKQNINVVCCILSLFEESRQWNRENYSKYFEVYMDVPMETLVQRDPKGLYKLALSGQKKDVVGVDIPFVAPLNPDYVFKNVEVETDFEQIAKEILNKALGQ